MASGLCDPGQLSHGAGRLHEMLKHLHTEDNVCLALPTIRQAFHGKQIRILPAQSAFFYGSLGNIKSAVAGTQTLNKPRVTVSRTTTVIDNKRAFLGEGAERLSFTFQKRIFS